MIVIETVRSSYSSEISPNWPDHARVFFPDSKAEISWGEVNLAYNTKLVIGSYYRTGSGLAV